MKYATTIDEQINKLQSRGLIIKDRSKAEEILLDIGYYRFCSYLFPFELSYPRKRHRLHFYSSNTNLEDGLDLYYFDFDLRRLLLKYLFRIEVNIRTYITYYVSNHYKSSIIYYSREALQPIHKDIETFAKAEHLTAHANSIAVRFEEEEGNE